jgi:hypothetical protein
MAFSPPSPVTGSAVNGLTSPTYTLSADSAQDTNGKQYAITTLGGTQTGVTTHSVSSPFTITYWKPKVLRLLGKLGNNGQYVEFPNNIHKLVTRKGVNVAAGQPTQVVIITTSISIPAGAETFDAPNVKAAISEHFGIGHATASGIADTVATNLL